MPCTNVRERVRCGENSTITCWSHCGERLSGRRRLFRMFKRQQPAASKTMRTSATSATTTTHTRFCRHLFFLCTTCAVTASALSAQKTAGAKKGVSPTRQAHMPYGAHHPNHHHHHHRHPFRSFRSRTALLRSVSQQRDSSGERRSEAEKTYFGCRKKIRKNRVRKKYCTHTYTSVRSEKMRIVAKKNQYFADRSSRLGIHTHSRTPCSHVLFRLCLRGRRGRDGSVGYMQSTVCMYVGVFLYNYKFS